jgi:hypothetical protein
MLVRDLDADLLRIRLRHHEQAVAREFARRAHGLDLGHLKVGDLVPLLIEIDTGTHEQIEMKARHERLNSQMKIVA